MKLRIRESLRRLVLSVVLAGLTAGISCSKRDVASQRRTGPLPTEAGLTVDVTPPTGISLGLDGNKVGTQAPFTQLGLEPGPHTLLVRGMGYLPVEMPIILVAGQTLKVAVSLRARPPEPEPLPQEPIAPRRAPERISEARPVPAPAPPDIGPELPPGAAPVTLHVVAQPEAPITVDDEASPAKGLALHHTYGIIAVGPLKLRYSIMPDRTLELTLPEDTATWQRDTLDVTPGTVIRFSRGFTRLRRLGADGDQSVILRWTD